MALLSRDEVRGLAERQEGRCVSIYLPTHRFGPEILADKLQLKNMLNEAADHLLEEGMRRPDVEALLKPARRLLDDGEFWAHLSDGLAVFLAPDWFREYRLPLQWEAHLRVGSRFYLKPLMPALSGDGRFFLLALSQDGVELWEGTRYGIDEVDPGNIPASVAELLRPEAAQRNLHFHTGTSGGGAAGRRSAVFYGQGGDSDERGKVDILRYFHRVDDGVRPVLGDQGVPLVLAGVEYLLPLYRQANGYPYLADGGIELNPQGFSLQELHNAAWDIVQPQFDAAREEAASKYLALEGQESEKATADLEQVLQAAYQERVATLFVGKGEAANGSFDPETGRMVRRHEAQAGDEDLLDLAAVWTLSGGGVVYAVEPDQVPGGGFVAAVLRY